MFPINFHHVDKNISLNLLQEKNAGTLFNLVSKNRAYLRQWLPWVDSIKSYTDEVVFIRTAMQKWQEKKGLSLGIWCDGNLQGVLGFNQINLNSKIGEIGYWLAEEYQRQGVITQSCGKLIEVGFQQLGLLAIFINCAMTNLKSQRIPTKLGFYLHETVKSKEWLYDHYVDHYIYKLSRPSYVNRMKNSDA
jgi:ribosomal-protein-serine acetyltransferase